MGQMLLLPDPKPLDERLGQKFFRKAPKRPGVYLMRDAEDNVLYVGKAKNLQQRLRNYRIANPDRMPRRHLRMLREVARIEFQFCPGESAALKRESKLLRSLKPRFNRAGVWPGKTRFIVWRFVAQHLELSVTDVPEASWQRYGPLGGGSRYLRQALVRLLWLALNPTRACADLPTGWAQGSFEPRVRIDCRQSVQEVTAALGSFFSQSPDDFLIWLESRFALRIHRFERAVIESELEILKEFSEKQKRAGQNGPQLALL
jgi:excinuclease UvrABC nuclease subunit